MMFIVTLKFLMYMIAPLQSWRTLTGFAQLVVTTTLSDFWDWNGVV